jgi:ribosomal protein S18 acetylase RimI-like enzyme
MPVDHLTPPDLSNGIPSDLPAEIPSQLSTVWVESDHARKSLEKAFRTWARHACADDLRALAAIRVEIWAAERGLQAPPDVCLAYSERHSGHVLGVLCGFPRHGHRDFFIQEVAIHPMYQWNPRASRKIGLKLLEAAMDVSVQLGYFGWVSCAPDEREIPFWRELGFSRHDDFTYRRMGYFH